jgi:hypothetical protein
VVLTGVNVTEEPEAPAKDHANCPPGSEGIAVSVAVPPEQTFTGGTLRLTEPPGKTVIEAVSGQPMCEVAIT